MGDIRAFEYSAILWSDYRNMAVHETATPKDRAKNLAGKKEPFYSYMIGSDGAPGKACFDIPPEFLIHTVESGLDSFRKSVEAGMCTIKVPPVGWTRRRDSVMILSGGRPSDKPGHTTQGPELTHTGLIKTATCQNLCLTSAVAGG